jgi:hypothetical protein
VLFVSSEGVTFGLHSKNLEVGSGGVLTAFSRDGSCDAPLSVPLPEPYSVLWPLFSFLYPQMRPVYVIEGDVNYILGLAEAAEKYVVFSARNECHKRLQYVDAVHFTIDDAHSITSSWIENGSKIHNQTPGDVSYHSPSSIAKQISLTKWLLEWRWNYPCQNQCYSSHPLHFSFSLGLEFSLISTK